MLYFIPVIVAALCLPNALAQLVVTQPTAQHWWVGGGLNTLAWTGNTPSDFQVFLVHPDVNVLTDRLALESIVPTYIRSKSINPGGAKSASGYTLQLTNPLNSTDIYATSESFEIKPPNSPYPSQESASDAANGISASGSSSSINSQSSSSSTSVPNGGSSRFDTVRASTGVVLGFAAFGGMMQMVKPGQTF